MFGGAARGFVGIIVVLVAIGVALGLLTIRNEIFNPTVAAQEAAHLRAETLALAEREAWNIEKERQQVVQVAEEAAFRRRMLEEQIIPAVCAAIEFIAFAAAVYIIVKCLGPHLPRR